MSERIKSVDAVRGFACVLMVIAHTIAWQFEDYGTVMIFSSDQTPNQMNAAFIWQIIYSFHMALFFLISGYFCYKEGGRPVFKSIIDKSKKLLIPYIVTGFLILIVRDKFGYWFLFSLWEVLCIGYILQYIMNIINKKKNIWIDLTIIITTYLVISHVLYLPVFTNRYYDLGYGTSFFLPFMMGFIMHKYKKVENVLFKYPLALILLFSFLFFSRYYNFFGGGKYYTYNC